MEGKVDDGVELDIIGRNSISLSGIDTFLFLSLFFLWQQVTMRYVIDRRRTGIIIPNITVRNTEVCIEAITLVAMGGIPYLDEWEVLMEAFLSLYLNKINGNT